MSVAEPETVVIQTDSGVSLHADLWEHERPRATLVLGHAMSASRRTFDRGGRGMAPFLSSRGFRVVSFDFRGHGRSGTPASKGGDWTYDDLVREDVPAIISALRDRYDEPIFVCGHSLGGNVTAASIGCGYTKIDGLVFLATNIWLPRFEPSLRKRIAIRAVLESTLAMVERVGYLPARRFRFGSDDESRDCFRDFARWWKRDAWTSRDGRDNYLASLANITCPILAMTCEGDRVACPPKAARNFLGLTGTGDRTFVVADRALSGFEGGHMTLVTDPRSEPAWDRVASWVLDHVKNIISLAL